MVKTKVSRSKKRIFSVKESSISAKEVKECFTQISRSPKSSRIFLTKIGITLSAKLATVK